MAIVSGPKGVEYLDFLNQGGEISFVVEKEDIEATGGFETHPAIALKLKSGFSFPPTQPLAPADVAQIFLYGNPWDRVIVAVHDKGGEIIYRQLATGQYEATCTIPVSLAEVSEPSINELN
jgi:hypothetical protein